MESLRELYRIGKGPSSSHSIGPDRAAHLFRQNYPDAQRYKVVLFGSLARTGEGHNTQNVIKQALGDAPCEIVCNTAVSELPHPNTMDFFAYKGEDVIGSCRVMSVGGGKIEAVGMDVPATANVYRHSSFDEIKAYCKLHKLRLWQYVERFDDEDIFVFLADIWKTMRECVYEGLSATGVLPGGLEVQRKAKYLFAQKHMDESAQTRENRIVSAYAFAASEQNASGGTIVTAPTCGSCGVLPAALLYMQQSRYCSDSDVLKALATAGIIGNIIKTNASISGAECGCQAEIGSACSMTAAALGELFDMDIDQIEYAAEVAMEHHLGLTCDPINGLVQIPCIERNAVGAMRAINAVSLANFLASTRKVSFDVVVKTMYETGRDLFSKYRETSEGGLAKFYQKG